MMTELRKGRSVCAGCKVQSCKTGSDRIEDYPEWCWYEGEKDGWRGKWLAEALMEYKKEKNQRLYKTAAKVESSGYKKWTRLQEIAEFALAAGFENIGLAFCIGLDREAELAARYFAGRGLEVNSVVCCCGSIDKAKLNVPPEDRFTAEGFEAGCNPIGQTKVLAECGTEFNVMLGLCVGHDALFFKYSEAPATVLAAKDRVLGHNPLAAVYNAESYYGHLFPEENGD